MFEKILQKLKQQRGQNLQVTDKTLESMAKTWSNIVKDDETLNGIDFSEQINSLQGNIGHIAKQVKDDTAKQFEGYVKPNPTPNPNPSPTPQPNDPPKPGDDIAAIVANAIKTAVSPLQEQIAKMQGEKITTTRSQQLLEVLKDVPEQFKQQVTNNFNRMSFTDDADFESFKTETATNVSGLVQMAKESGITFPTSSAAVKKPVDDGRDSTLASASKLIAEAKAKETKTT